LIFIKVEFKITHSSHYFVFLIDVLGFLFRIFPLLSCDVSLACKKEEEKKVEEQEEGDDDEVEEKEEEEEEKRSLNESFSLAPMAVAPRRTGHFR
jgi:hypothetical protein